MICRVLATNRIVVQLLNEADMSNEKWYMAQQRDNSTHRVWRECYR